MSKELEVALMTFLLLLFPGYACAYVDPGTTGLLYQLGYMAVAAFFAVFVLFRRFISDLAQRLGFPSKQNDESDS